MKKVFLAISTILFSIVLGFFVILEFKLMTVKKDNVNLKKEIEELTDNYDSVKEENILYEERISSIKKEKEDILKEEEVWKKTKENLENILS